ncbi:MAG: phosphatase PAP2 family protein [Dehalococcoidia bacterium]|nr:MAG: phosphatase PAP2 family protein [bacterium]MCE7929061.1 phosphatase PAP2 family protein [Chloroflexi bacterium CFX7]MCK6564249.1 phosphatase PAP2 family protein [Dehalococcoidia bacterium]MCL4232637.1 phosphatase PAP2 family protein [Dehalococcoidia bacterium]NUQ55961.1 phosphatase PAP2 family protein [Dehalococcoidia bacterium]
MSLAALRLHLDGRFLLRELLLIGIPIIAFLGLMAVVVQAAPTGFDRDLGGRLQGISWGPYESAPALVSDIAGGVYGFFLVPSAAAAFLAWRRQWALLVPLVAVFALHYAAISPKTFIQAYRPSPEFGVAGAGGLESFPSGHVEWATSFYGLLAYMGWRRVEGRGRYLIASGWGAIVVLTMLSRIELGRHWPIDTVAGFLIGLVALRLLVGLHSVAHRWQARAMLPPRMEGPLSASG